jgi:hypothetical protein
MRGINLITFAAVVSIGSAAMAEGSRCPKWERGALYPWQSSEAGPGDHFASLSLDVDRTGYPFRCTIVSHNYPDPEQAFWVCKNYRERWRGPPAGASEPDKRTLKRTSLIAGYERLAAERKARKQWFKDHPDEQPSCYPERVRPDRLDW